VAARDGTLGGKRCTRSPTTPRAGVEKKDRAPAVWCATPGGHGTRPPPAAAGDEATSEALPGARRI
jgi:hypothetical protein